MAITTGILAPDGQTKTSWGRVRGCTVLADIPTTAYDLTVNLLADESQTVILDKTATIPTGTHANWPRSDRPQFSAAQQRCQFVAASLSATPALAVWTGIDLWVAGTPERAPSRNKS
jgi:hypothetical protein